MIDAELFTQQLEETLKPFDGVKFSSIADICMLRTQLNKTLSGFARKYPKMSFSGKLEIKSKTSLSYTVDIVSSTDMFYPGWVCKFRYAKNFDVFTRGKRRSSVGYKVPEELRLDAVARAAMYLLGSDWKSKLKDLFQTIYIVQDRIIMNPDQRSFVDNVRKLTWNKIPLACTRDIVIHLVKNDVPVSLIQRIPLDTKAVASPVNTEASVPPKAEKVIKRKSNDTILENTCYYCKKWMSSRNTGDSGISFASCPIRGRKTLSSDSCGNFKHV